MKQYSRNRILGSLLAGALTLALVLPAGAALVRRTMEIDAGLSVYVGDTALKPTDVNGKSVDVFSSDGTTYLPVRALSGALDQAVGYKGANNAVYVGADTSDSKDAEYLKEFFGITPLSATVTRAELDAALEKLGSEKTGGTGTLTLAEAVKAAVNAAGLEKLALTYTAQADPQKAAQRLAAYGVTGVPAEYAPYVAAALDSSLAFAGWNFAAAPEGKAVSTLLMNAVELSGRGRNYLGRASDSDIYAKLQSAWKTFGNFENAKLSQLGADLVVSGASTGYNLKFDGYNANFLSAYTLQYGHSDIDHAVQLMALLKSEDIDAKVAMEPKTSIYEYMVEWGDPAKVAQSDTYAVRPIGGGRYLCYATEYDMKLEFDTLEEKNAFDSVINTYAKKWIDGVDADGEPTTALLAGAWFQPLYSSAVPMADSKSFSHMKDNVIRDGAYTIHPFSTLSGTAAIAKVVEQKAPDLKVEPVDLYVNNAFFRYLTGTGQD